MSVSAEVRRARPDGDTRASVQPLLRPGGPGPPERLSQGPHGREGATPRT